MCCIFAGMYQLTFKTFCKEGGAIFKKIITIYKQELLNWFSLLV